MPKHPKPDPRKNLDAFTGRARLVSASWIEARYSCHPWTIATAVDQGKLKVAVTFLAGGDKKRPLFTKQEAARWDRTRTKVKK